MYISQVSFQSYATNNNINFKSCATKKVAAQLSTSAAMMSLPFIPYTLHNIEKSVLGTNPEQTDELLIKKIEKGNKPTEIYSSKTLDINDPIYEDIPKFSEYIHSKMEKQMGVVKPEEISAWADNLGKKYNIPQQEVLDIMSRLTQFGSFSQLTKLGDKLSLLGISDFYRDSGISANMAFRYISNEKKQFNLSGKKHRKAFILDDAGLKYLENLDNAKRNEFIDNVKKNKIILINLDGTSLKIGDNYYSYTIFDGAQSLEAMTEAVIIQKKKVNSLEKVINTNFVDRTKSVLGSDIAKKIKTIRINDKQENDALTVANQIKPNMPNKNEIIASIEIFANQLNRPDLENEIKVISAKYADNMLKTLSNDTLAEILKNKHKQIEDYVKSIGKSTDDIIYIYPNTYKSFVLISYMYSKINHVEPEKFIYHDIGKIPEGKVAVLLDDLCSSGQSFLHHRFHYDDFIKNNPTSTVIFAPCVCDNQGYNRVLDFINFYKNDKHLYDKILCDNILIQNINNFTDKLNFGEQISFSHFFESPVGTDKPCTSFQYMIPDNCTGFAGFLLNFCLNNNKANKLYESDFNKSLLYGAHPLNLSLLEKIKERAKELQQEDNNCAKSQESCNIFKRVKTWLDK